MTLQQLRDFIAVIEHGGFRAAARALNVSQGGLTKSLARLEDDHGVSLLARDAKGLELTRHGQEFLHLARATVLEADRASQWLFTTGAQQRPTIAIGISIDPALRLAPTVLNDFRSKNPDVSLQITQSVASDLLLQVRDNRIEIALVRIPADLQSDDLHMEVLYQARPAILARAGHPMAKARSVGELIQCDWIVVGSAPDRGTEDASLTELFDDAQLGRPRIAAYSSSLFDTVSMLMESDCLARLPQVVLDHPLVQGRLVAIPVQDPPRPYRIGIVYKSGRRLSRVAQMLCAMIASYARIDRTRISVNRP
ncbi:LysR family transcriptional regulator [Bordetella sp. BOR01]|uniref:LysR family transcriptional regulator n=1 Tax=Bordetella sp. BOR01 TaxID=2854779 RepID=UPI001C46BACF|nr:LysR family transcriptional regulator [Bordetella sp. BOR01]MBV7483446.1 LysR family transcriptional regulator [Bordetella sp. BOR01]